ncbi:hypothetical protein C0J52_18734 [Blattella germanica]|nr:hypothetical protein C0J52_18734 [Blattella germanica]
MLKLISVVAFLGCLTSVTSLYVCRGRECIGVNCTDPSVLSIDHQPPCKENQSYNSYGTFCGCCPACVDDIELGSPCSEFYYLTRQSPPLIACKKGLVCQDGKCSLP